MRKFFTMILMGLFVCTFSVANAEDMVLKSFADVNENTEYNGAILWMADNGIIEGYEDGTFKPDDCVKRGEFLKLLFEMMGVDENSSNAEAFTDTPMNAWYTPYVLTARERNTVEGYPDGTFKPGQCVKRAEAVKMAVLEFNNGNIPILRNELRNYWSANDIDPGAWYYSYLDYALSADLVGQKHMEFNYMDITSNYGVYGPGESMTRKEVAEMLYRMKALFDNAEAVYSESLAANELLEMNFDSRNPKLEEFFPEGTVMLFTVDTQDSTQKRYFSDILSDFPQGDLDEFTKALVEEFNLEFAEAGVTYENDVYPIIGDSYRAIIGMLPLESFFPEFYIAITIKDKTALDKLVNKLLVLDNGYSHDELFGFEIFTSVEGDLNTAYTDDVMLITNSSLARYKSLRRIIAGEPDLLDNTTFANSKSAVYEDYIGSMYFDFDQYLDYYGGIGTTWAYDFIDYEVIAAKVVSDGMKLYVDVDASNTSGTSFSDIELREPYMYKNIPGNDLIMYVEGYNFLNAADVQSNLLKDSFGMDYQLLNGGVKDYSVYTEWMDKGYAFVIQDNKTSTFPAVSIYFDANSSLPQAHDTLDLFNEEMDLYLDELKKGLPETVDGDKVLKKENTSLNGHKFYKVTMDYSLFSEEELADYWIYSSIPPIHEITDDPVELYYGITDKGYFVLTTYFDYIQDYNNLRSVKENTDVSIGMDRLTGYPYALSYISIVNLIDYADNLIEFLEIKHGDMPADLRAEYENIKEYLSPIKYLIGGNKEAGSMIESMMFVRIGE